MRLVAMLLMVAGVLLSGGDSAQSRDGDASARVTAEASAQRSRKRTATLPVPDTPKWRKALAVGPGIRRPEKIAGSLPDFQKATGGGEFYLGTCILGLVISPRGQVDEAHVLIPRDGAPEARHELARALKTWTFTPATRNGNPVAVRYFLTVNHCPVRRVQQPERP